MHSTSFVFYLCLACIPLLYAQSGSRDQNERGSGSGEDQLDPRSLVRNPGERNEEYYMRILERRPHENYEKYKERIIQTKKQLPHLPIWENNEYISYAPVEISEDGVDKPGKDDEDQNAAMKAKEHFKTLQLEAGDKFFRTVLERRSGESIKEYNKRISKLHILLPQLQEWIDLVEEDSEEEDSNRIAHSHGPVTFAPELRLTEKTANIYKNDRESEKDYYYRILHRNKEEHSEDYFKRLSYLMNWLPRLRVWDLDEYNLHLPNMYTLTEFIEEVYYEE